MVCGAEKEGNFQLCSRADENLISLLIAANLKYGRRARWLNALEVFLECNGKVSGLEKNQDLILRLLLEDRRVLLDFTCDYTDGEPKKRIPQAISAGETRRAMNRIELMLGIMLSSLRCPLPLFETKSDKKSKTF